jgi:hypothetical protein
MGIRASSHLITMYSTLAFSFIISGWDVPSMVFYICMDCLHLFICCPFCFCSFCITLDDCKYGTSQVVLKVWNFQSIKFSNKLDIWCFGIVQIHHGDGRGLIPTKQLQFPLQLLCWLLPLGRHRICSDIRLNWLAIGGTCHYFIDILHIHIVR